MNIDQLAQHFHRTHAQVSRVILGQQDVVHRTLIGLLAGGHVLVEGVPGLGKTLLVRTMAHVLTASFKRIQFTPDLMPSDVTGGNVFNQREDRFVFMPGPVFTQLLLADEINRAPAKTQSALLEAMQDKSVTTDGVARALPKPFFVIATQNPVESQGTYPLPEAQLDRFLLKIHIRHPEKQTERRVLEHRLAGFDATSLETARLEPVLTVEELLEMQRALGTVRVAPEVLDYLVEIVTRTRSHRAVYLGASPRGSVGLLDCARAEAASQGRDYVVPDDIKSMAAPVLGHRLILHPDAELEGVGPEHVIDSILSEVPVPKTVG